MYKSIILWRTEVDNMSYDRINNSRGHGIDNIRIRCLSCNRMAKDLDDKL